MIFHVWIKSKTDTSLIAFEGAAGMSLPGKEYHAGKQTG